MRQENARAGYIVKAAIHIAHGRKSKEQMLYGFIQGNNFAYVVLKAEYPRFQDSMTKENTRDGGKGNFDSVLNLNKKPCYKRTEKIN